MIPQLAADARSNRASWADIATALGTSPEQAELGLRRGGRRSAGCSMIR